MRPSVLLMDEPFAALDAMTKASLQDELHRVREETGTSIVFVTHDIEEAVYLGDRIAVITRFALAGLRGRSISICPIRATRSRLDKCRHFSNFATPCTKPSDRTPMASRGTAMASVNVPGLVTIAACALVWELLVRGGAIQYAYFPATSAIAVGLYELMSSGQLWQDIAQHCWPY